GQVGGVQALGDHCVAFLQPLDRAREALHGPRLVALGDVVDVGEVARAGQRQAERIDRDLAFAEVRVAEAEARRLGRFVVVLRDRPGHRQVSGKAAATYTVGESPRLRNADEPQAVYFVSFFSVSVTGRVRPSMMMVRISEPSGWSLEKLSPLISRRSFD